MYNYLYIYSRRILLRVKNIMYSKEESRNLGRWCHVSLPKCSNNVIEKKIDFANYDNSLCYNKNR